MMRPAKKDCCHRGSHGHRGGRRCGGGMSPAAPDSRAEHQLDQESHARESASGDTTSGTEDELDATTKRHPTGTPPDASHSPPAPRASLHTTGHTQCRPRSAGSPEKKICKDDLVEEAKGMNKRSPHHHQGLAPALLILIVLLALVGIYSLHNALNKAEEERAAKRQAKPIADVYADLKLELKSLNWEFSQPRELWLGVLGQLESVMVDEPLQPAVLLLVVPDDSKGAAICLAHRLARAIQHAFEDTRFVMFDTRSSEYKNISSLLKIQLDDTLQGLSQTHAAVVHNVESIPGPAAMILHAYCDNENAPFKQSIIFLLAEIPGTYAELGYSRLDSVVDSHLGHMWGAGLAEKDVSALISRTSNTPILVRPERPARVLEMCPL